MIRAFILGVLEFRNCYTTNCGAHDAAYEWGRELAHRVTLRRFEQS